MAKSFSAQSEPGLSLPTTNIWDTTEIYETEVTSDAFKELMVRLYQNLSDMSDAINLKESAYYVQ